MNFRHNIWGYFEVTDPFEVTNEVTEIFDFQNFSRQFAHFCSSYEKASKCYQVIKSRVFEPKYWPLCVKKQTHFRAGCPPVGSAFAR